MNLKNFFSELEFNFDSDFELKNLIFEKNDDLTNRIKDKIYFYKCPNKTNTSFYLLTEYLKSEEKEIIRKYIWNKNDADLFFLYNEKSELDLLYAKYSPKIPYKDCVLDSFSYTKKDENKIEKIKQWQFDSGVFWDNYREKIEKSKYKGIDKELIDTLEALKNEIEGELKNHTNTEIERKEIVQALIDRTLYIKYLEDNHIINSYFYKHYFKDEKLSYGKLLKNNSNKDINKLFQIIHEIFNNTLFEKPTIDNKYLTKDIRDLIASSFNTNLKTKQLHLFDFQFDVLPTEFISYIYEVFLSKEQKSNGIYYTPKKLAQLIVDDVINEDKIGSILDPSCGSGMFLIIAFDRLLEIAKKQNKEPVDSLEKIKFRTRLLAENIYGIEKQQIAQRFTLFSLSLQIFNGINPKEIKEYIANELKKNNKINLFSEHNIFDNIKLANTLDLVNKPFADKTFLYIIGNPPFFEIKKNEEFKIENEFLNKFEIKTEGDKKINAKNIVGSSQISQCFFLKIKEWADYSTRFGFVSNTSNFYNEYSDKFQNFFYANYAILKIYELSRVKKILFEKAKESVFAIIFTNENKKGNKLNYYPVDLGLLSEKPFELLVIKEDNAISIEQNKLINKELNLRDFLVANEYDLKLLQKLNKFDKFSKYIKINIGFSVLGDKALNKEFKISIDEIKKLNYNKKKELENKFLEKYIHNNRSKAHNNPYIDYKDIKPFIKTEPKQFISSIENFKRSKNNKDIFDGKKLLINRILTNKLGKKINCVISTSTEYFNDFVYSIKLNDENFYYFFQALLNSNLIQYYLDYKSINRLFDSNSRINKEGIENLPIPKDLDLNEYLINQISDISQKLSNKEYNFEEKEEELNNLIYDLYELSYWERQRIKDYFNYIKYNHNKKCDFELYKKDLKEFLDFYFKNQIQIEGFTKEFNLMVIKILFKQNSNTPDANKIVHFSLNEIFSKSKNTNFLACQEKIFTKDCIYIIKENIAKNWTETKAYEDGHDIIKKILDSEDGERIN